MRTFTKLHKGYFGWIATIILLSFASFWRILGFGLWKDDWSLIWSSLYNTYFYHGYFNHPGTPLEFFLLSPLFGTHALLWQSLGLLLHMLVSICVGLFISALTSSKKTGVIAGIFFAASYLGLETIYFPSVQVIQLAAIPLLISLVFFLRSFKRIQSNIFWAIVFFSLAFLLDPPRIAPVILLFPFLLFLFSTTPSVKILQKIFRIAYPIFSIGMIGLLVVWFVKYSPNTLLGKAISHGIVAPSFIIQKAHVFGHFFATIANIFIGLIYSLPQDEQNTAYYVHGFGYLGLGIFLVTCFILILWIRTAQKKTKKKQFLGICSFFLFWILVFYLPNWVSEPRAPMAGAHRYVFLSSIGFVGLIAYLISKIQSKKIFYGSVLLFLGLNIYKANALLSWQYTYRASTISEFIWTTVAKEVPAHETNDIFMFYGAQPWIGQDIYLSGAAPYALIRNTSTHTVAKQLRSPTQMPILTVDIPAIQRYLCNSHVQLINLYFVAYKNEKAPLSHVYAWKVLPGGRLVNISGKERINLKALSLKNGCNPLP